MGRVWRQEAEGTLRREGRSVPARSSVPRRQLVVRGRLHAVARLRLHRRSAVLRLARATSSHWSILPREDPWGLLGGGPRVGALSRSAPPARR